MPDKIIQFPRQAIGEAGGLVDETSVAVAVYGEDLDPIEITRILGCEPTSAHRRGERLSDKTSPSPHGAWLLVVRGMAPVEPEELTSSLLQRIPEDESIWIDLAARYDLELRFAFHMNAYSRGFDLSPELIHRIARLHATVGFDIFADGTHVA